MTTSTRFARSPSLRIGDDDLLFSSPDPLATSVNDENSLPRSSTVKGASPSPRKHRRTKVLEDITLSSPQKGRTRSIQASRSPAHYQSEQFLSPWKIRVTVEAEPEEAGFGRMKNMSKTTIVPLRDPSSPTRESGLRGRSNSGSRKPGGKRSTTGSPARHARKTSGADFGRLTDLDTAFLDDHGKIQTKPKRKQGTRRSRKAGGSDGVSGGQDTVSHTTKPDRDTELLQSISNNDGGDTAFGADAGLEAVPPQASESPELRELDFNRISVQRRGGPPRTARIKMAGGNITDREEPPASALPDAMSSITVEYDKRHVAVTSAITYPTPDASVQDDMEAHGPPSDPTEESAGFDTILESEGFTMIDIESLPSARHFVTSPDNLEHRQAEPSASENRTADLEQPRSVAYPVLAPPSKVSSSPTNLSKANKPPPTPIPSYLAPPEEGESDLSSTVPSSPPVEPIQHIFPRRSNLTARSPLRQAHTPVASAKSSPTLPSPPNQPLKARQLVLHERTQSTPPRLGRVVRAGIALQGLLSPKAGAPSLQPSPIPKVTDMGKHSASTPKERLDDLFVGFDSGTRRELRAGLRFGEELAKRQRLTSPGPSSSGQGAAPMLKQQVRQETDTAWRGETLIKRTPVRYDDPTATRATSCGDLDVPASQNAPTAQKSGTPFDANKSCGSIFFLDAEARERRWQSEREAISRQIENANASQVIVVDSDEEDETHAANGRVSETQPSPANGFINEAEEDIWLAEAEDAQNSSRHTAEDLFPPTEQIRQRERAKEIISKPKRTLIPSPWKRGEDVDSTSMTNGDASGIFWQQPKGKEVISSLRCLLSKSNSEGAPKRSFDIKRMIGRSSAQRQQTSATTEEVSCQILEDTTDHGAEEQSLCQNEAEASEREDQLADEEDRDVENVEQENDPADEEDFEAGFDLAAPSGNGEETYEESSIPPGPTMVPVKFNDTTDLSIQSRDHAQENTQLESPPSSPYRPITPRSALKGSRASLYVINESASPTPRRVVFSRQSLCLDDSGLETSMDVRGNSLSPESSTASDATGDSKVQPLILEIQRNGKERKASPKISVAPPAAPKQTEPTSWFSKLAGWGSKPAPAPYANPVPHEAPQRHPQQSSKPSQLDSDVQWEATRSALMSSNVATFNARSTASSVIPSNASDPRFPPPPETLPVSGYFSDNHYKHLHILYLKSLKPTFTRPGSIRPALKKYIGQKCYSGDGEFAWEVTGQEAEVVERWIRSFEGREAREWVRDWSGGEGRYREIGWDEWDLCKRLFSIVAGQEVRREVKEKEKEKGRKKREREKGTKELRT